MKKLYLFGALIVVSLVIGGCAKSKKAGDGRSSEKDKKNEYTMISQDEAKKMMEEQDGHVVVDVRREDEYAEGHIPGAILVPNESIDDEQPAELPDLDQVILIYCRSGNRSKQASQKLVDIGYTNIYEFGGIIDWTGEVVSGDEPFGDNNEDDPSDTEIDSDNSSNTDSDNSSDSDDNDSDNPSDSDDNDSDNSSDSDNDSSDSDSSLKSGKEVLLSFSSFDGGGPEFEATLKDDTLVEVSQSRHYALENHEELEGAAYSVNFTFVGKKAGKTTMKISEFSPIMGDEIIYNYKVKVDDDLVVTIEEIEE